MAYQWTKTDAAAPERVLLIGLDCGDYDAEASMAELERLTDEIEQTLQNSLEREVSTEAIGEQVMEKLKTVDEVAYVRFASVYRQFKDINSFMRELNKILEEK